ncbi:hypothetical protein M514_03017 [Trichuris suis]|uniref:Uncharacterized protein n=1 Tax=Trichuris suis TaxID=68888 RepID=A0A085NI04_9BILA|nr:hypothetical protein M513_03017 [Trichuris suis]KFD69100.1 hypothetical protein M514_03017 [Trichuris suis]
MKQLEASKVGCSCRQLLSGPWAGILLLISLKPKRAKDVVHSQGAQYTVRKASTNEKKHLQRERIACGESGALKQSGNTFGCPEWSPRSWTVTDAHETAD